MAGIQQAVSSLATGLAYARKVREYGSMQKANLKVQEQKLALQKQKVSIQKKKEANKSKELDLREYQAKTERKLANLKVKQSREGNKDIEGNLSAFGSKEWKIKDYPESIQKQVREQLKGGKK